MHTRTKIKWVWVTFFLALLSIMLVTAGFVGSYTHPEMILLLMAGAFTGSLTGGAFMKWRQQR